MKVRLNERTIDDAVYEGPGFGVRTYPTGSKSFVVSYWIKNAFYTIGRYGQITLRQAQETALEVFLQTHPGTLASRDPTGELSAQNLVEIQTWERAFA